MGFRLVVISATSITAGQLGAGVTIPVDQVTTGLVTGRFTVGNPAGARIDIDGTTDTLTMYDATNTATITQDPATQSIVIGAAGRPQITMDTTNLVAVAGIATPGAQEVLATGSASEAVPGAISSGSSGGASDQGVVVVSSPVFTVTSGPSAGQSEYGTLFLSTAAKDSAADAEATLAVIGGYPVGAAASSVTCRWDGSIVLNGYPTAAIGGITMPPGAHILRGGLSTPTLGNGWTNFGGGFAAAKYIELPHNYGAISGVIKPGTTTNGTIIFTLPAQVAPLAGHTFDAACGNGAGGQIIVGADGTVKINNVTGAPTFVALSGMTWPLF